MSLTTPSVNVPLLWSCFNTILTVSPCFIFALLFPSIILVYTFKRSILFPAVGLQHTVKINHKSCKYELRGSAGKARLARKIVSDLNGFNSYNSCSGFNGSNSLICRNSSLSAAAFFELPAASACAGVVAPYLWLFTHNCFGSHGIAVDKIPSVIILFKARKLMVLSA